MINGIIISGCSGVGKSTVIHRLLEMHPEFTFSISCTTRQPRPGEKSGVHYNFISQEEFMRLVEQKYFLEWEKAYTDYYGTPREALEAIEGMVKVVMFELDTRGAVNLKEKFPQFTTIALLPPSIEDLTRRLVQRGSESADTIASRQKHLREELQRLLTFDFALVNEDIEETVSAVERIVLSLNYRTKHAARHIEKLLEAL
ncbi:MAG: guanylate kinase [Candidatus Riflebacteria bacterium RBG_13_59_9]|nr:MAG: guanylate kinase [Candidatus Riflebacteria bacterium RBG_13_59_9]